MSGYSSAEVRGRAADAGFDDFLVKPIDLSAVMRRLENLASGPPDA